MEEIAQRARQELINQDKFLDVQEKSIAGNQQAIEKTKEEIRKVISALDIEIDLSVEELVEKVYSMNWGLNVIEDAYHDPEVDDIQINGDENIFLIRRGVMEQMPVTLPPGTSEKLAIRLTMHDAGISIAENCRAETIREDGSRIIVVAPPVGRNFYITIRKQGNVDMSVENLEKMGTLNQKVWEALGVLVRGRCNILISGPMMAGKTSLLRELVGFCNPKNRIMVVGTRGELRLGERYPDRNIVEIEARKEKMTSLKDLFESVIFKMSAASIIYEEFKGFGETIEAVRSGTKGQKGSMATTHAVSAEEAIRSTAMIMLEEGINLPLDLAMLRVAQAYDLVIQMFYDQSVGIRKLVSVTEVLKNTDKVQLRELIRWVPNDAYMGAGSWEFVQMPTDTLIEKMYEYGIERSEVERLWGITPTS